MTLTVHWEDIMRLTHDMARQADAGEWDEVLRRETERRKAMEAFFAHGVSPADAEKLAEGMRELMALDKDVMVCCRRARDEAAEAATALGVGRRAQAAYTQSHARGR